MNRRTLDDWLKEETENLMMFLEDECVFQWIGEEGHGGGKKLAEVRIARTLKRIAEGEE